MTFQEFITKYNGKYVDTDNAYGGQCMDLMHQFCIEILRLTQSDLGAPAAKDVYLNFTNVKGHEFFDRIDNTPINVPQEGDIMFWGTKLGAYGHVAIFVEGDANSFRSFDQNFPIGSPCHVQNHTYNGVLGWLRFKSATPDLQAQLDLCRQDRDNHYNARVELYNALGTIQDQQVALGEIKKLLALEDLLQDKDKQLNDATGKINDLELKVKTMETENANLFNDNSKLKKEIEDQGETILDQGSKISSLVTEIAEIKKAVLTPVFQGWKKFLIGIISKI